VVQGAHLAATLAWLLPLLALACVLAGGVVHPGRRGAVLGAGAAVSAGGVLLLLTAAAGQWWSSSLDRSSLAGAAKAALWAAFGQPLFRIAALTVVLGGLLAAIAASGPGYADIRGWVSQLPGRLASRPQTTGLAVLRAVAIGLGGLGLIFWTERMLSALAVLIARRRSFSATRKRSARWARRTRNRRLSAECRPSQSAQPPGTSGCVTANWITGVARPGPGVKSARGVVDERSHLPTKRRTADRRTGPAACAGPCERARAVRRVPSGVRARAPARGQRDSWRWSRCSWTITDQVTSSIARAPFTVTSCSRSR
jgi:hypothetical protein